MRYSLGKQWEKRVLSDAASRSRCVFSITAQHIIRFVLVSAAAAAAEMEAVKMVFEERGEWGQVWAFIKFPTCCLTGNKLRINDFLWSSSSYLCLSSRGFLCFFSLSFFSTLLPPPHTHTPTPPAAPHREGPAVFVVSYGLCSVWFKLRLFAKLNSLSLSLSRERMWGWDFFMEGGGLLLLL